jgi:anti-sigma B factor antagonist
MADLEIEAKRDGPYAVVVLKGEARLEQIDTLRATVRALIDEGATRVVVGFKELKFADSASVGALLELQRSAEAAGGGLAIHGVPTRLARMFEGMGLASRMKSSPSEAAARKLLAS